MGGGQGGSVVETVAHHQYSFTGFAKFTDASGRGVVDYGAPVVAAAAIAAKDTNATFLGKPAYRIDLVQTVLGDITDRYVHYEAEALNAADVRVGSFDILSHTNRVLYLSPESGAFPATATKLRVSAKFFQVVTGGLEGLGATYIGSAGGLVPIANVRIGFAFHDNPKDNLATRFPAQPGTFVYNLDDPAVQEQVRALGLTFVQWDVVFDGQFKSVGGDVPPAFGPTTPRPELQWLRLPYRF